MRTKICGITSFEDAMAAIDAGTDALGFVFYKESSRYISKEDAKKIIKKLPPFIEKVALFVNEDAQTIDEICSYTGATLAQIHFEADQSFYASLKTPHLKVIRAKTKEDVLKYQDEYRLIDAYSESYGGAGKRINTEWFDDIDCSKIILAGGLDPQNVADLKQYGFYGVDVSSGVEKSKGKKDHKKVGEFIKNAR
ncbi:phosphoribosylanthranilate isomerase [Sulfurimonas sp. HSL-1716]|uniref:phosphoribosylanthranilate isomerase n=1 Tax=Hydrocurvibacter sulfurireducens TaxID=3131937 RepID=UPI0031F9C82D